MLADDICSHVAALYQQLQAGGRSAACLAAGETVVASVVAVGPEIRPITLTTGLKALPDTVRAYSHGRVVHDSHAEVLAVRAFNRFLIGECKSVAGGGDSWLVQKTAGGFKIADAYKLALLISEPPCGDASMGFVARDAQPWKKRRLDTDIVRGRNNFDMVGVVRTKPGRHDSPVTLSKSCSDKLCVRQLMGLTNCVTFPLFPQNVFLEYLVLPQDRFLPADTERCFRSRFRVAGAHYVEVLAYSTDEFALHLHSGSKPSPLSLVHIVPTQETQVLCHGVRNGAHRKNKAPAPGGDSFLCKQQMFRYGSELFTTDTTNYIEFKRANRHRMHLKDTAATALGSWRRTSPDNFYYAT